MKAILFLLLFAFIYSIPNPVYTIKACFEKFATDRLLANKEIIESVENELLKWKVNEFWEKLDKVDPTLRPKIEECVQEVNKKFQRPFRKY